MQQLWNDLFGTVYRYTGFGIVFAVLSMIALSNVKSKGIKTILKEVGSSFVGERTTIWQFLFFYYLFMILARTLICRDIWLNPWQNPIGEWGVYTSEGELNSEGFKNIVLFIPLSSLYFMGFYEKSKVKNLWSVGKRALWGGVLYSMSIECCQLFARLGTFQLSDIGQNVLGSLVGAGIYLVILKVGKIKFLKKVYDET